MSNQDSKSKNTLAVLRDTAEKTWSHVLEAMLFPSTFIGFMRKRVSWPNKLGKYLIQTKKKILRISQNF